MTIVDWRELLDADDGLVRQPPAGDGDIAGAEAALDARFPDELRALYRVSDGVFDGPGQWFFVWPLADVVARNQFDWSGNGVPDADRLNLVGFSDDGTGAPFCVRRDGGRGVFAWSPIDGDATYLTETVHDFFSRWQTSSLPHH